MHTELTPTLTGRATADFAHEIAGSLKFFVDYMRKKPGTHGPRIRVTDSAGKQTKMDVGQAFGLSPRPNTVYASGNGSGNGSDDGNGDGNGNGNNGPGNNGPGNNNGNGNNGNGNNGGPVPPTTPSPTVVQTVTP